ncbi:type II secretion system F family protein [Nakamurella leprariae]|uniref:Type II secretion system F family protein n=1 Tax=Nakamurella leprariae TaxID=2803911 RepID=A0A938Y7H2_9ACTN|nr:type II secretion system F family protein [Nakamurella leprariae]MBM9467235.1 type II secretion system F family protein [Nakamurella leprariae]
MGSLLGLVVGIGVLLVWHGCTVTPSGRARRVSRERTQELLLQAGLPRLRPGQLIAAQLATALLVAVVAVILTQSLVVSAVFGAFGATLPRLLVHRLRVKRRSDLRELWPEVVDNLTSGVRAGLSLPEALAGVGIRGPEPLREPFLAFGADYRASGRFDHSLDRLKAALADPVGDRICESLRVAREVGGTDLGRLLGTLSGFLRDDARTRAELLARQSWSVNAARMAVAAPWLVLMLLATQQETLAAYDTPVGAVILVTGAGLSVLAYRLMVRIGQITL